MADHRTQDGIFDADAHRENYLPLRLYVIIFQELLSRDKFRAAILARTRSTHGGRNARPPRAQRNSVSPYVPRRMLLLHATAWDLFAPQLS